jgi:hypothetical protein
MPIAKMAATDGISTKFLYGIKGTSDVVPRIIKLTDDPLKIIMTMVNASPVLLCIVFI